MRLRLGKFGVSPHLSRDQVEMNAHREVIGSGLGWGIANDEAAPCLVTLVDDLGCILFVFGFAGESKGVLALAIGNLVDPAFIRQQTLPRPRGKGGKLPKPLVSSPDQARKVTLDVFDVVELWSEGVMDVDDDDFPVCFAFVEQGHDAENLDLLDLTCVTNLLADLADIKRVIVTLGLGLCMSDVRVLPGLSEVNDERR